MAARKATKETAGASQAPGGVVSSNPAAPSEARPRRSRRGAMPASTAEAPAQQTGSDASDLPSEATPRRGADRIPFGKHKQRLAHDERPGYVRYWFNDTNDRLDRALQAGWAFVKDEKTKKPLSRPVGKSETGGPLRAFRMEIPKELYDEDFRVAQQGADAIMDPIRQGKLGAKEGDNRYVPKHTPIKFEEGPAR